MTNLRARFSRLACLVALPLLAAGCGGDTTSQRGELRFRTDSFTVRVSPETRPTRALDDVIWRVTVHDRTTGTPIQGGQGRIFATSKDHKSIANGLEETGELGTYRAKLMYVTAGMWAMALEFRRDSTQKLQRTEDWTQDILSGDEPGVNVMPLAPKTDTTKRKVP
jgi:hypothetical protein